MAEPTRRRIGVLGASSGTGTCLLESLAGGDSAIIAYSRSPARQQAPNHGHWEQATSLLTPGHRFIDPVAGWVSVAPLWTLPQYLPAIRASGARALVAVSSTSAEAKRDAHDPAEQEMARRLLEAESTLLDWSDREGVDCTILRPTLVHGLGRDRNITVIADVIRRFGVFPLLGRGTGLRQPLHATDLARACTLALEHPGHLAGVHTVTGAETLTYRTMVTHVFEAMGKPPRFLPVPRRVARGLLPVARLHPRWRHVTPGMLERMNRDLAFQQSAALEALGYSPSAFRPLLQELSP